MKDKRKKNEYELGDLKILTFYLLATVGTVIIGVFAAINIYIGDYLPAFTEIIVVLIIFVSVLYVRSTKETSLTEISGPAVILIMSIQNFITGGFEGTGLLFMMPYPLVVTFMAGARRGVYWVMTLLSAMVLMYIMYVNGFLQSPYSLPQMQLAFIAIVVLSFIIYIYQKSYERTHESLLQEIEKLQEVTDKMEGDSLRVHKVDKKLKRSVSKMAAQQDLLEKTQKAILNVLEDIAEEKEETLKQKENLQKFKEAVDNASDHIVITDPDGAILYANKAVEKITGYRIDEIIAKTPAVWGNQMSQKFYKKFWERIKDKKKTYKGEIVNQRKNGKKYVSEVHISPIIENDEIKAFVGIERD
ncbi:PAS domain S-box protein, partial [Candidatus Dojkabacteria bacterium]|nr:PAS domain S-box protein [Candidatus Dojkabacteria bacterium]